MKGLFSFVLMVNPDYIKIWSDFVETDMKTFLPFTNISLSVQINPSLSL